MKLFKYLSLFLIALYTFSCNNESVEVNNTFIESEKCNDYVTMKITEPCKSRYMSLQGEDEYTASRCQDLGGTYVSVAYHGRNGVQKGIIQLVNSKTGEVTSELDMLDARINFTHWHKSAVGEFIYIGVDKQGKDSIMCGIVPVKINKGKFDFTSDTLKVHPYRLDGWSVNCIKSVNNESNPNTNKSTMYVATGGNTVLGETNPAGFTKFLINSENPMKLSLLAKQTSTNYRGYWISYDSDAKTPLGYAYRTIKNGKLTYCIGVIPNSYSTDVFNNDATTFNNVENVELDVWQTDIIVDKGRFCVTPFVIKNGKFIAVCNGDKEFGIRIYRYDSLDKRLVLVDTWNKAATCLTRICGDSGKYYMFAACGNGVYKLELQYSIGEDKHELIYINPVAKRVTDVITESGTLASANYVQLTTSKIIHVAGGYEGYYKLEFNDPSFISADKRK